MKNIRKVNSRRSSVAAVSNSRLSRRNRINPPLLWAGWVGFLILVLLLVGLGAWKRNWVLAAMVNNRPVWGLELLNRLDQDYRKGALDNLINEKIILDEARLRNAVPTDAEVQSKLSEQETKYGGAQAFDQLLVQFGKTREQVKGDIKLGLAMEKMFGSQVTITDREIDDYIKQNKSILTSTDPAKQKEEAQSALHDQKQRQIFTDKFNELKSKANVKTF